MNSQEIKTIEVKSTVNFVESHNYCYGCGKDNVPTWDVRLSWRTHEELCENCLHELYPQSAPFIADIRRYSLYGAAAK